MTRQLDDNLSGHAYSQIKKAIISLELPPGKQLKELELSEKLNISRTPIREAITRLTVEGFVDNRETGNFVPEFSVTDFVDLYQIRESLELLVVKLGSVNWMYPEELEDLKKILDMQMQVATKKKMDSKKFLVLDKKFHEALAVLSKNKLLINEITRINDLYYRYNYHSPFKTRAILAIKQHMNIVKAMEEGDSIKAQNLMKKHLHIIRETILVDLVQKSAE